MFVWAQWKCRSQNPPRQETWIIVVTLYRWHGLLFPVHSWLKITLDLFMIPTFSLLSKSAAPSAVASLQLESCRKCQPYYLNKEPSDTG